MTEREAYSVEEVNTPYAIDSLDKLWWAFRKLQKVRAEIEKQKETAAAEVERINSYLKDTLESLERDEGFFSSLIEHYYRAELEADPKAKCATPYGKATKRTATVWDYGDEEALTQTLMEAAPECVKTEYKLNKAELKKAATVLDDGRVALDGEILDGVTVEKELRITVTTEG